MPLRRAFLVAKRTKIFSVSFRSRYEWFTRVGGVVLFSAAELVDLLLRRELLKKSGNGLYFLNGKLPCVS